MRRSAIAVHEGPCFGMLGFLRLTCRVPGMEAQGNEPPPRSALVPLTAREWCYRHSARACAGAPEVQGALPRRRRRVSLPGVCSPPSKEGHTEAPGRPKSRTQAPIGGATRDSPRTHRGLLEAIRSATAHPLFDRQWRIVYANLAVTTSASSTLSVAQSSARISPLSLTSITRRPARERASAVTNTRASSE
jgi:hypothetical protein